MRLSIGRRACGHEIRIQVNEMDQQADQYRNAVKAAQAQTHKEIDAATKEAWLRHASEWSRIAGELEKSGK